MGRPGIKRSIKVHDRKTSISMEQEFWDALREIAAERGMTATKLIAEVEAQRAGANLSSHLRVYVLTYYRAAARRSPRPKGPPAS